MIASELIPAEGTLEPNAGHRGTGFSWPPLGRLSLFGSIGSTGYCNLTAPR